MLVGQGQNRAFTYPKSLHAKALLTAWSVVIVTRLYDVLSSNSVIVITVTILNRTVVYKEMPLCYYLMCESTRQHILLTNDSIST